MAALVMVTDRLFSELAEVEVMIAQAEAELAELRRRLEQEGRSPEPSDPSDPVGCLEIWLAALRTCRKELSRRLN